MWFCAPHSRGPDDGLVESISRDFTIARMRSVSAIDQAVKSSDGAVLFLDFECPSREDLEMIPRLKQKYPSIPIFLFTTLTSADLAIWAFRAGVRDYFVKPATASWVVEKVRRCMGLLLAQGNESRSAAWQSQSIPMPVVASSGAGERKLRTACQYIEKFHHRKITLDEVAGKVLLSPYQLCRLFRKKTGFAFREYLVRFRLIRAESLLLGTSASITEIACAVGFSDCSNFQRLFRKKNSITPREFRKNGGMTLPAHGTPERRVRDRRLP